MIVISGYEGIVELLLKKGAKDEIDFKNNDGWTALTTAAYNSKTNQIK